MAASNVALADLTEGTVGSSTSSTQFHEPQAAIPTFRFWLLVTGLSLGLFLSFVDSSIVATSLFTIGTEFNALETINWVALAYTLAYLGFAVFFARCSDVIGRRNAFLVAFVIFFAFSIGCGFCRTESQLIACRTIQGIGGSGLYSIPMIILPEVSSGKRKQYIASVVGIVIAVGGVLGPVLGGILTHYASWRWIFWINGPIGTFSMILFYLSWPKADYLPDLERLSWSELDYPGSILLIAAAVLVVFPFQYASSKTDIWGHAVFLAPLILGVVCWIVLIVWEILIDRRRGDEIAAAFPMRLMKNYVYVAGFLNTMFLGFTYIMLIYAFPLRLQVVNGKSALDAGLMLLPMLGASAVGSALAGAINGKRDKVSETLTAASAFVILGSALLSTLSSSYDLEAKALGYIVFVGFGFGLSAAGSTILANYQAALRDHAPAQGILAQVRILGGSIGIAASAAILGVTLRSRLAGIVDPSQIASISSNVSGLTQEQLNAVRRAYSDAFNKDMRVSAIIAALGFLSALAVWRAHRRPPAEILELHHKEEAERRAAKAREAPAVRDKYEK